MDAKVASPRPISARDGPASRLKRQIAPSTRNAASKQAMDDEDAIAKAKEKERRTEEELSSFTYELLKERLEDVSMRAHKYQREIDRLHAEARHRETEASKFIKFLQSEVKSVEAKSRALERELKESAALHESEKKQMRSVFDGTLKRHEAIFLQKEAQLLERNKQLVEEFADLNLFRQMREELATELEATKETIGRNERKHKAQLDELERKFVAAKAKLEQDALDRIARSRQAYKEEVGRELDQESKQVRKENRDLSNQLRFHEERSNALNEQNLALQRKVRALTTELGLARQLEEEQVKRGMRAQKQLREMSDKTQTLERSLTQVLRDFELEREVLHQTHEASSSKLEQEKTALKVDHDIKTRELAAIRKTATALLAQRSEVERFLHESLAEVKAETRARRQAEKRQVKQAQARTLRELAQPNIQSQSQASMRAGTAAQGQLSVGAGYAISETARTAGSMDLGSLGANLVSNSSNSMTPEDRERVLRLLYAKVTGLKPAVVSAEQLPRHSFDIQLDNAMGTAAAPGLPTPAALPDSSPHAHGSRSNSARSLGSRAGSAGTGPTGLLGPAPSSEPLPTLPPIQSSSNTFLTEVRAS